MSQDYEGWRHQDAWFLALLIDNDQPTLRKVSNLCKEILNRKHGDRNRMVNELAKRIWGNLNSLTMDEDTQHRFWGVTLPGEGWMELLEHYESKLKDWGRIK